jgi:hypothetical protein
MTTSEQILARRHRQNLDVRTMDRLELNAPERENAWVSDFIGRLAGAIRHLGGKGPTH